MYKVANCKFVTNSQCHKNRLTCKYFIILLRGCSCTHLSFLCLLLNIHNSFNIEANYEHLKYRNF